MQDESTVTSHVAPYSFAPVVVFAFNRPDHLGRTLAALAACAEARETQVTIYCDGPRHAGQEAVIEEVRRVAGSAVGFSSLSIVARDRNLGLAASIIGGVTSELASSDRVIVIEDDLVVSPHFLRYMNDGLDRYANDESVASIHGYVYPITEPLPETFFLRGADCWGWATWRRAWKHFDPDGRSLLARLKRADLLHAFDLEGAYPYSRMLADQIAGRNHSWAIRWHASCFLRDALTLYPGRSLVDNVGNDATGTHCNATEMFVQRVTDQPVRVERIALEESVRPRAAFIRFFRARRPTLAHRLRRLLGHLTRSTA